MVAWRSIGSCWAVFSAIVMFALVGLSPANAVSVSPGQVLPNAISYEYFGLNVVDNIRTSNTVGTLSYTGQPGCGGICEATTSLGSEPSIYATVNEVPLGSVGGGEVQVALGYYVALLGAAGPKAVTLHAIDSIIAPDGAPVSTHLLFGQATNDNGRFNDFRTLDLEEADCLNGCPSPGFAIAAAPFVPDHLVQMEANTLYYIQLEIRMRPGADNVPISALIDPTFSADEGEFVFSPGAFSVAGAVPEPSTWAMMLTGLGTIGALMRRPGRARLGVRA